MTPDELHRRLHAIGETADTVVALLANMVPDDDGDMLPVWDVVDMFGEPYQDGETGDWLLGRSHDMELAIACAEAMARLRSGGNQKDFASPDTAQTGGISHCSPFSLSCIHCDAGMDMDTRSMAEQSGWTGIEEDADGFGHNHTGLCPACLVIDSGSQVEYGVVLVRADKTEVRNTLRWRDWNDAAKFGEGEVAAGMAAGFRIFHESAV